jgi:hypothetical protein
MTELEVALPATKGRIVALTYRTVLRHLGLEEVRRARDLQAHAQKGGP